MIVAVGIDMVELDRIRAVLERHPERFLERHFHPDERAELRDRADPVPGLAARFAAKEAFQKCWAETIGWRDVWVVKQGRRPQLAFSPDLAAALLAQRFETHLSLTHTREHAAALVVLERHDGPPPR